MLLFFYIFFFLIFAFCFLIFFVTAPVNMVTWSHGAIEMLSLLLLFTRLFFLSFPFCRGEAGLLVTPLYGCFIIFSIAPCCWLFLSTFLPPLPFLDLSSHNLPILDAYRVL